MAMSLLQPLDNEVVDRPGLVAPLQPCSADRKKGTVQLRSDPLMFCGWDRLHLQHVCFLSRTASGVFLFFSYIVYIYIHYIILLLYEVYHISHIYIYDSLHRPFPNTWPRTRAITSRLVVVPEVRSWSFQDRTWRLLMISCPLSKPQAPRVGYGFHVDETWIYKGSL